MAVSDNDAVITKYDDIIWQCFTIEKSVDYIIFFLIVVKKFFMKSLKYIKSENV